MEDDDIKTWKRLLERERLL